MAGSLLRRVATRARYEATMRTFDLLDHAGLGRAWLSPRTGGRILGYHGVAGARAGAFNARFISTEAFEAQMEWMSTHFHVVSLEDFFAGARAPDRFTVALTFDDGYRSWLDRVLPVLHRYRTPAAFFVTAIRASGQDALWTDLLDLAMRRYAAPVRVRGEVFERHFRKGEHLSRADGTPLKSRCRTANWAYIQEALAAFGPSLCDPPVELGEYWRTLDADGLRELASSPFATVGSHGLRHLSLLHQTPTVVREELEESKRWLERIIGRPVRDLSFPFGISNSAIRAAAREAGYARVIGSQEGDSQEPQDGYGRVLTINPYISWANQVRCIHAGSYP